MSKFREVTKIGAVAAAATAALAYGVSESIFTVEPGFSGVLVDRTSGLVKDKVYREGKHLRIPWFENPIMYNAVVDHFTPSTCSLTFNVHRDLFKVTYEAKVVANPVPDHLPNLHRKSGDSYRRFMEENIDKVVHDVIPQFDTVQLCTEPMAVLEEIKARLAERLDDHGLNIKIDEVIFNSACFKSPF